jgi:histidinol-phosphate/aromatic aminotransferase/cobyric acid decarboxylase-like protein
MAMLTDKELAEIRERVDDSRRGWNLSAELCVERLEKLLDHADELKSMVEMLTAKNAELRRKVEAVEQMQPFESLTHMVTLAGSQDEEDESWWRWAYEQGLRHTSQRRGKTPWAALGVKET